MRLDSMTPPRFVLRPAPEKKKKRKRTFIARAVIALCIELYNIYSIQI